MSVLTNPARRVAPSRALKAALAGALAALTALALPVVADASQHRQPPNVNVMSRNLYLGAELGAALTAPDQPTLFTEAGTVWRNMQETNFNARAKVLADEVVANNVEVLGLQEVALWRRDTKGAPDGPATPAEEVVYDFLHQLQSELRARGARFEVVSLQEQSDFEVPLDFGNGPVYDGRLTMHDAILVREKPRLLVRGSDSARYGAALPVPLPGFPEPLQVWRGWNSVELVKLGKGPRRHAVRSRFRVVNTHLEAFSAFIRFAQANQLVASGRLTASKPVILIGDLNSDPADPTSSTSPPDPVATPHAAAYGVFMNDGFVDRGVNVNTCCHDDDLLNAPPADFGSRIDHVLTKPRLRHIRSELTGADESMRTPTGLWPSDHGGVFSRLRLRR